MQNKKTIILLGALTLFFVFFVRYLFIDPNLYQFRDDGIITLSHAKNWVEYGFIGINPSGGIVEGTSAPLQFMIYTVVYLITQMHYSIFSQVLTSICTLLMGVSIMWLFFDRQRWAFLIVGLFGIFLAFQSSFIQWHGSGMENAMTHGLLLATVCVLLGFYWNKKINYRWVIVPILASICRIDSIFHLFPLLSVFALLWYFTHRNFKALQFFGLVAVPWISFNFLRYLYFGDWLPNTAHAQGISIFDRLSSIVSFDSQAIEQFKDLSKKIYFSHAGHWLLFLLYLPWVDWKKKYAPVILLSIVPIITALIYPAFFGPSRLDFGRTNTHMPIFIFLLVISIFLSLKKSSLKLSFATFGIILGFFIYSKAYIQPYYLCCDTKAFNQTHSVFKQIADQEQIFRPTVANPDLGIVSWHKDMNILDLGMIGSPGLAKIKSIAGASNFILEFSAPDMIESHDIWSCVHYHTIFNDPRFNQRYQAVHEKTFQDPDKCGGKMLREGIWIRKDMLKASNSKERKFHDALAQSLTLKLIQSELENCKTENQCTYVTRTVYRFLPEIKKMGEYDRLLSVYAESGTANDFDRYLLGQTTQLSGNVLFQ